MPRGQKSPTHQAVWTIREEKFVVTVWECTICQRTMVTRRDQGDPPRTEHTDR